MFWSAAKIIKIVPVSKHIWTYMRVCVYIYIYIIQVSVFRFYYSTWFLLFYYLIIIIIIFYYLIINSFLFILINALFNLFKFLHSFHNFFLRPQFESPCTILDITNV